MAKTPKKSHNELKFLKEQIRDLQKENRRLKRQVKQTEKYAHIPEETTSQEVEEVEIEVIKNKLECLECGKGHYEEFEIMDRIYGTCNICEDRKRIK